ncbi:TPA: hypothetical protein ACJ2OW_004819 [Klebsiella pneumoniae]
MTSKFNIDNRELLQRISCGEAVVGIDFGNLIVRELAAFRLAAIDSEPVGEFYEDGPLNWYQISDGDRVPAHRRIPLYRHAQPAQKYPEVLPCSVLLEPGLRFGKGIKTSAMLAAMARRSVHESDMAALSPEERAEFQAGIEDFKALIEQPAPVVPEKMEPTIEAIKRILPTSNPDEYAACIGADMWNACRAAMLQAGYSPVIPEGSDQRIAEAVELLKRAAPEMLADDSGPNGPLVGRLKAQVVPGCWCRTCRPVVLNDMRFVVCPDCGNKRCPRANDHRNACTGSNEPCQEGSAYPDIPREVK